MNNAAIIAIKIIRLIYLLGLSRKLNENNGRIKASAANEKKAIEYPAGKNIR